MSGVTEKSRQGRTTCFGAKSFGGPKKGNRLKPGQRAKKMGNRLKLGQYANNDDLLEFWKFVKESRMAAYIWRQLTGPQRAELLESRILRQQPWHSPPRFQKTGRARFHLAAACFEHAALIGHSVERMDEFASALLAAAAETGTTLHAWCVLPNHYHALVECEDLRNFLQRLGRLHGAMSHRWNGEENRRGRQVFCKIADRVIRSDRHFWASMNYIHHNPVHHGYVKQWMEWPWSSAGAYLQAVGRAEAERIWREFPVNRYGAKWDSADI